MQYRTRNQDALANMLGWLRKLCPPQHLLHVGAGTGIGSCHVWQHWSVSQATLIDANEERLALAKLRSVDHPGWRCLAAVVAAESGQATFFQASNPDESGLLSPERLKSLWPNLLATGSEVRETRCIDELLDNQMPADWLIVDCLPALPVLRGAAQQLAVADVVCLRCLLTPQTPDTADASLAAIDPVLQEQGFCCIEVVESHHPAIGHALFVRRWPKQIDSLTQACTALEQEKSALAGRRNELQAEVSALTQARDQQATLAAERQQQIDSLTQVRTALEQEKSALTGRRDELQTEVSALTQARDQQATLAAERQQQIDSLTQAYTALEQEKSALAGRRDELQTEVSALTQARDQQATLATERQQQIDSLTQVRTALEQEKSALTGRRDELQTEVSALTQARDQQATLAAERQQQIDSLTQARTALEQEKSTLARRCDELDHQLKERDTRIAHLEQEMAERDARQHLLNEEITRAEAQIDLIKDVLLREPGL
ncbi:hypothetical protein MASR1M60_15640 [Rhodocyclaceae bacterium]